MNHDVFSSKFAHDIYKQKYSLNGTEEWADTCKRVVDAVLADLKDQAAKDKILKLMIDRKFIPGGRYLYSAGRPFHQVNNCFLFRAEDTREDWADLMSRATSALLTGGGIGVDYSNIRHEGAVIKRTGGFCTGPISLMEMVNEAGRHVMQGGQRRSAIWAGLSWKHQDVDKFMHVKDYSPELKALKEKDFNFRLPMEYTNISVIYDTDFFDNGGDRANQVWLENCKQAFKTAEPGMAFNYKKDKESLRNACTEVVSEDDSDKCNLGTLWINRFDSLQEFEEACDLVTLFLLFGGIYSDVPNEKVRQVGNRNNRIGVGLGGMHEWLMVRGSKYEVTPELHSWLTVYRDKTNEAAAKYSASLGMAMPKGIRSIAPTGTIGIIAETTTGIEPLFCKAYKRRYLKGKDWVYQYVVDQAVKRLMNQGVKIEDIQDAYDIGFEDRVKFQADVQDYVDMAISSTCNLPQWGSELNNDNTVEDMANILLKYAKRLRGFTCYPDGCRGGQPLTRVPLDEALASEGQIFEEKEHECVGGVCGI